MGRSGDEGPARGEVERVSFRLAWSIFALALIAGGLLRLVWIDDMEWKKDEQFSYQISRDAGPIRTWPALGMQTSLSDDFRNPGLSVWVFIVIGRFVATPTAMARVVAVSNILALLGFAVAVRTLLPVREREPWIWALALQAVNPFSIRVSRKIWPPSVLPLFLLWLWVGHLKRDTRWGALSWGLAGALIGQVHLGGWYVAVGLVLGTILVDFRGPRPVPTRWTWWLLGSLLGALPALNWALAMHGTHLEGASWSEWIDLLIHVYLPIRLCVMGTYFFSTALGIEPEFSLGLRIDAPNFLKGPILGGGPTFLIYGLQNVILCIAAVVVAIRMVGRLIVPACLRLAGKPIPAASEPDRSQTRFYLWSTLFIPGLLYLLTIEVYYYHYFYITILFLCVLVASIALPWRRLLVGLVVAQATISVAFLVYIHAHGGSRRGEFGVTYAQQLREGWTIPPVPLHSASPP